MIYDRIEKLGEYTSVPAAKEVMEELMENDFISFPKGEYRTKKSGILFQINELETEPDPKFETHGRFIDIHVVLEGEEYYEGARILPSLPADFDEEKDIAFFDAKAEVKVTLRPGAFALSFPLEPHRPRVSTTGKKEYEKKIVVKIPY